MCAVADATCSLRSADMARLANEGDSLRRHMELLQQRLDNALAEGDQLRAYAARLERDHEGVRNEELLQDVSRPAGCLAS